MSKFLGSKTMEFSHVFLWLHRVFFGNVKFLFFRDNSIGSWTKGPGRPNPRLGRAVFRHGGNPCVGSRSFVPVFLWYFVDMNIKKDQQDISKIIIPSLYIYSVL